MNSPTLFLLSLYFNLFASILYSKTVYLVPICGMEEGKWFFDPQSYRDETAKPFVRLREELEKEGYTVKFTRTGQDLSDIAAVISFNETPQVLLENLSSIPKEKCLLFIFEPPMILPRVYERDLQSIFGKIFVLVDSFVDNQKYFKFFYPQPRLQLFEDVPSFHQKKFAALIAEHKSLSHAHSLYYERRYVIFFYLQNPKDLDLYGIGWNFFPNWKGMTPSKWETLKNYKFSYCYENSTIKGYITEKIFDVMISGSVPIYWGAPNVTDYIPPECFIDRRDFKSNEELHSYLKSMDERTYQGYLDAIRCFLSSSQAQLFSIDSFIERIKSEIQ